MVSIPIWLLVLLITLAVSPILLIGYIIIYTDIQNKKQVRAILKQVNKEYKNK